MKNLENLEIGDKILGRDVSSFYGHTWIHGYEILDMEPISTRWGKPDRILKVKITAIGSDDHERIIDYSVSRWFSDLL